MSARRSKWGAHEELMSARRSKWRAQEHSEEIMSPRRSKWGAHERSEEQMSARRSKRGAHERSEELMSARRSKWGGHECSEEQMRSSWALGGANEELMSARRSKWWAHDSSKSSEEQSRCSWQLGGARNNVSAVAAKPPRRGISVLDKILCALFYLARRATLSEAQMEVSSFKIPPHASTTCAHKNCWSWNEASSCLQPLIRPCKSSRTHHKIKYFKLHK